MSPCTRTILLSLAAGLGLMGCDSAPPAAPPVVETRKPGEESKLLPGVFFMTDGQIGVLRTAGLPDSAIIQRDIVRSICVDDLLTIVLEGISEEDAKALKYEDFAPLANNPKDQNITVRRNHEGNREYLTVGPMLTLAGLQSKLRFATIDKIDEPNRIVVAKYRGGRKR